MSGEQRKSYKRVVLKLSGEELMGQSQFGIDPLVLDRVAHEIYEVVSLGVQLGIVIGGGNLFRGQALSKAGLGRVTGDQMGMLATIMNSLALRDALERAHVPTRTMSAIPMMGVVDAYDRRKAVRHLESGRVLISSAGTGNPFFTTDSAASLRAVEMDADLLIKATNVDGIYSADPAKNPQATLFKNLTFAQVLEQELGVMDLAAFCQCRDFNIPIRVFRMSKAGALMRVIRGEEEGTFVSH
jgi:uridylate kinase